MNNAGSELDEVINDTSDPKAAIRLIVITIGTVRRLVDSLKDDLGGKIEIVEMTLSQLKQLVDGLRTDNSSRSGESKANKAWLAAALAVTSGIIGALVGKLIH